jgi:PPE-repeat protein
VDFSPWPPEVISARIHAGPGADSLLEAATVWESLGAGLEDAAGVHGTALAALTEAWQGPSSTAMVQAVKPYLKWLRATAQQCQQMAVSVQDAVAAFSAVRASVVPVAEVRANRTRLVQLLATNRFGINLPAIAATEEQYLEMWATDSAAMARYQSASAQATTLSPFSSPPSITDSAGASAQAGAVSSAAASASGITSAATSAFNSLESAAQGFNPNSGWFFYFSNWASQFVGAAGFPINLLSYLAQLSTAQSLQGVSGDIVQGLSEGQAALGAGAGALGEAGAGAGAFGAAGLSAEPTAAVGVALSMGKLTVPPAVVGLLPGAQVPVQLASAATPLDAADADFPGGFPVPPLMPPPISAGSGWRKRKQQTAEEDREQEAYEAYEDPDEFEPVGALQAPPTDSPGSGWRKRANYDDIEIGAELKGKVVQQPPSAG